MDPAPGGDGASVTRRVRDRILWHPWSPRAATTVAVLSCLFGSGVIALGSPNPERAAIMFLAGAGWVVLGAYHRTRNRNPLGAIAVLTGLGWYAGRLDEADDRVLFTIGQVGGLLDVPWALLALLTFPTGRISRSPAAVDPATGRVDPRRLRAMRWFVVTAAVWAVPLNTWTLLVDNPASTGRFDGRNLRIADLGWLPEAMQAVQALMIIPLGVLFVGWFERAFRQRGPLHREAQLPVRVAVRAMVTAFCAYMVSSVIGWDPLTETAVLVSKIVFMMVPVLYGFGLFRWAELEGAAAAMLDRSPAHGAEQVQEALRVALRDPGLRIEVPASDPPGPDDLSRTAVTGPDGTVLAVAHHGIRQTDSSLLDTALAWAGRRLAPADATDHPEEAARWTGLVARLTDAELTTAELLSRRLTNQQIAGHVHVALGTVHNRVTRIYQKLELDPLTRRERAAVIARLGHVIAAEQRHRDAGDAVPPPGDRTG